MEFSPRKSKKTHAVCCVYGCASRSSKRRTLSFHKFPKNIEQRKNWIDVLNINFIVKPHMLVCSLHFSEDNYNYKDIHSGGEGHSKRTLKYNSVPSLNLPMEKKMQRNLAEEMSQACTSTDHVCQNLDEKIVTSEIMSVDEALLELNSTLPDQEISQLMHEKANKSCQVKSGDLIVPFSSLITTNRELFTLCGIPNFTLLKNLTDMVLQYYPDVRKHKLSVRDRIILATLKLKLDLSFTVITILFKYVSVSTCRQVFYDMINKLASILKAATMWVPKDEILNNIPVHFQKFSSTVLIVDCTEVVIQKSKCLKCRIKSYSQYKSNFTVKFMVGVTPAGIISFVSESYGGRASDKAIFEQSNVINMLDRNDSIMVDKGFMIDEICDKYGVKLIRPPHLRNKKQLSESDALLNREIASARVHVERMNQRIKNFDILNNKVEWSLISHVDNIFLICCGLANLSSPILADDKFVTLKG